jgi:TonB-linked SusC/RagA family outer membrane protein
MLQSFAIGTFSQNQRLSINQKNISIENIIQMIEDKTDYYFMYSALTVDVKRTVDMEATNKSVPEILDEIFKDTDISWKINGRLIALSKIGESPSVVQQLRTVSGKVTDSSGAPLPGVTVVVKGTPTGTITGADGRYSLFNIPAGATLQFSFVGMKTQEVVVGSQANINAVMEEEAIGIEEVVAVGYGVQKKINLTGSLSTVGSENIVNKPVANTINLLQGQMAGVQITVPGGQPGNDQGMIRVRGAGSIGTDINNANKNNPLIIIDGIQADLNDLGNLNPSDIANLSVLKDAASSAIYGSQAAGGVILVTTKRGEKGKARITLNTLQGIQQATVLPDFVDSWEYAMLKNEARRNAKQTDTFSQEEIDGLKAGADPDKYANTNWLDYLFDNAMMSQYELSVNGGTDKLSYLVSGGYLDQDGILLNQSATRANIRSNISVNVTDKLKIGMNIWGSQDKASQGYETIENTMMKAYFAQPLVPVKWTSGPAAGLYAGYTELGTGNPKPVQNPVQAALLGSRKSVNNRINIQINGTIEILTGLKYSLVAAYKNVSERSEAYNPTWENFRYNGARSQGNDINSLETNYRNTDQYQIDNLFTYEKQISANHYLNILLGQSALSNSYLSNSASVQNLPGTLQVLDVGVSNPQVGGSKNKYTLQSFFGRLNYGFKDKYLFEANFRYDGSSRFPKSKKYGIFPSFSGAWRITEEAFMKNLVWMSNLKLRGSWGVLGNQNIGNYPHTQTLNLQQNYLDANGNVVTGAAITSLANDILQWEETSVVDVGLDFSLWKNKLDFTIDYFRKMTDGILTTLPLPLSLGNVTPPYQNAAKVLNRGWEYLVVYRDKVGKLNYQISANLSTLYNEVTDFNGQERIYDLWIIREGEQINSYYGLDAIGIFQTPEEVSEHAFQTTTTAPGDLKYRDVNHDEKIDENDRVVIGKMIPKYSYGFDLKLFYGNIDFSATFQGIDGAVNYAYGFGNDAVMNPRANTIKDWLNRWTPEKPSTKYIRVKFQDINNTPRNSYWLRSGDYLRLKNIQLGYTFRKEFLKRSGLESLRLYFSGQNILTFTKVKHWDPEQFPSVTNMQLHPQTKVYALGLNINF